MSAEQGAHSGPISAVTDRRYNRAEVSAPIRTYLITNARAVAIGRVVKVASARGDIGIKVEAGRIRVGFRLCLIGPEFRVPGSELAGGASVLASRQPGTTTIRRGSGVDAERAESAQDEAAWVSPRGRVIVFGFLHAGAQGGQAEGRQDFLEIQGCVLT